MGKIIHNSLDPRVATVNHDIPALIRSKYPEKWLEYTSFVVVRNTWDRAHSFFTFYRNVENSESYKSISFDEWVLANCPPPKEDHLRAFMHGQGRFDDVLCQLRYVKNVDEVIVLHSFDGKKRNIELQNGMDRVCDRIGMNRVIIPTNANNQGRSTKKIEWKSATVNKLREKYSEEIEKFSFVSPLD